MNISDIRYFIQNNDSNMFMTDELMKNTFASRQEKYQNDKRYDDEKKYFSRLGDPNPPDVVSPQP